MTRPRLIIRKRVQMIQGKKRPTCYVEAVVAPTVRAVMEEHFVNETLFKRASYSTAWPAGAVAIPAALAPHIAAFLKNDACPEVTVKSMLAGQTYQGASIWDALSFELIAKVAFDNICAIADAAAELDRDVFYPQAETVNDADAERRALDADTLLELNALSAAVAA